MFESFSLFRKKRPFFGENFGSFNSPQPIRQMGGDASLAESMYRPQGFQPGGAPSGGHHQGMPDMTKKPFFSDEAKEAIESLSELEFSDPAQASLGKAGGRGGGKFSLVANPFMSHEMMSPSGGRFDPDEQKKRWWRMQGLLP